VIDNNSEDRTREVASEFGNRNPGRFRYVFEPQQGKSYALNAGIREARGEILAFMDDDVTVDAQWLQSLTAIFQRQGWAGVGGRVLPERTFTPPAWLSAEGKYALAPLAMFDLGPQPGELIEAPFGTNMAFRKESSRKSADFARIWVRGRDRKHAARTPNLAIESWERDGISGMSLPPSSITRFRRIACKRSIFLSGGTTKLKRTFAPWASLGSETPNCRRSPPRLRSARQLEPAMDHLHPSARRFSCKLKVWMILGEIAECHRLSAQAKHG